jgi:hypothetical protein
VTRFLDEKTRKKVQVMGSGAELLSRLRDALGPDAHLPASALTGALEASYGSSALEGLVGAHEVCYEYVAEREQSLARGDTVDSPRHVKSSRSYAQLAALGGAPGAMAAARAWRWMGRPARAEAARKRRRCVTSCAGGAQWRVASAHARVRAP